MYFVLYIHVSNCIVCVFVTLMCIPFQPKQVYRRFSRSTGSLLAHTDWEVLLHREKRRKLQLDCSCWVTHIFVLNLSRVWRSLCHLKICFEFLIVEMVKSASLSCALNIEPPNSKLLHRMSRTGGAVFKVSWEISSVTCVHMLSELLYADQESGHNGRCERNPTSTAALEYCK